MEFTFAEGGDGTRHMDGQGKGLTMWMEPSSSLQGKECSRSAEHQQRGLHRDLILAWNRPTPLPVRKKLHWEIPWVFF